MIKKLSEIAEITTLSPNTKLFKNIILISRNGKKSFILNESEIKEYQGKNSYIAIKAKPKYIDAIFRAINSKEFNTWFNANAKGTAMPMISVEDLKEFSFDLYDKNSFDFVKRLIEAERYEAYEKDYWGGADVIIVSSTIDDQKKRKLANWENGNRKLVITSHASAVIWFIETLKPYVDYDYLSKYEYYLEIASYIEANESLADKELLISLLGQLGSTTDKRKKSWLKTPNKEIEDAKILDAKIGKTTVDWESWYNYGIEHNDPFFVKFMTLWIAFNEQYKKEPQYNKKGYLDERLTIQRFCEKNIQKLLSKYEDVFVKSKLTEEFCNMNSLGEYYIMDMRAYSLHSPYENKEEEDEYVKYRKKDCANIKSGNKKEATLALFNSMYAVRCNLFHGGKEATNERDIELVRCSGEILEMYMNALLDSNE